MQWFFWINDPLQVVILRSKEKANWESRQGDFQTTVGFSWNTIFQNRSYYNQNGTLANSGRPVKTNKQTRLGQYLKGEENEENNKLGKRGKLVKNVGKWINIYTPHKGKHRLMGKKRQRLKLQIKRQQWRKYFIVI